MDYDCNEFGFAPNGAPIRTSKMTITITVNCDEAGRMRADFHTDQPENVNVNEVPFTAVLAQRWMAYHMQTALKSFDMNAAFDLYYEDIMLHKDKVDPRFVESLKEMRPMFKNVCTRKGGK